MADYSRVLGSHWLLLSSYGATLNSELVVYDSMYDNVSASTATLVRQLQELYATPDARLLSVQWQGDSYNCGVFTLTFASSIALGQNSCVLRYDRASMAHHLV